MSQTFFRKENLRNRIFDANKQPVQWEPVGNDFGVKVVDTEKDKATFDLLEGFALKRKLGVTKISQEIYNSQKKNPLTPRPSQAQSVVEPLVRVFNKEAVLPKPSGVGAAKPAVVAGNPNLVEPKYTPPAPPGAPPRAFTPRTKKASVIAAETSQDESKKA